MHLPNAGRGKVDMYPYETIHQLLLGKSYEEITSRKLHFSLDSLYEYMDKTNASQDDFKELLELWNPQNFFQRFRRRIPNEEEEVKVKAKVNETYNSMLRVYRQDNPGYRDYTQSGYEQNKPTDSSYQHNDKGHYGSAKNEQTYQGSTGNEIRENECFTKNTDILRQNGPRRNILSFHYIIFSPFECLYIHQNW